MDQQSLIGPKKNIDKHEETDGRVCAEAIIPTQRVILDIYNLLIGHIGRTCGVLLSSPQDSGFVYTLYARENSHMFRAWSMGWRNEWILLRIMDSDSDCPAECDLLVDVPEWSVTLGGDGVERCTASRLTFAPDKPRARLSPLHPRPYQWLGWGRTERSGAEQEQSGSVYLHRDVAVETRPPRWPGLGGRSSWPGTSARINGHIGHLRPRWCSPGRAWPGPHRADNEP